MPFTAPLLDRLADKYELDDKGCFVWTGGAGRYGRIWFGTRKNHRTLMAHRAAWEEVVGPIPDGLQIDHLCKNTRCINPDHLEPVTPLENLMRSPTKQRENALKTHCIRRHPLSGNNLFRDTRGMRQCRICTRLRQAKYDRKRRAG